MRCFCAWRPTAVSERDTHRTAERLLTMPPNVADGRSVFGGDESKKALRVFLCGPPIYSVRGLGPQGPGDD